MSDPDLIAFISKVQPVRVTKLADELYRLALRGADIELHLESYWITHIEQAAKRGLLEINDGKVSVKKQQAEPKQVQQSLF